MATPRISLLLLLLFVPMVHPSDTDREIYSPTDLSEQEDDILSTEALGDRIERAHGILGTVTFALLFPLGGILVRLLPGRLAVYIHAAWQLVALCLALTTLGMGVWLAQGTDYIESYHAIVGMVVVAGVCVQPVTGWLHHRFFKKVGRRCAISYAHMYLGIGFITLGAINGGFGLELAGVKATYVIVYAVLAALVWVSWMGVSIVSQRFGGLGKLKAGQKRTKRGISEGELKPRVELREATIP